MKLTLAILTGKIIYYLSRLLKIGGGSAAPGLYALKVDPNLVKKLSSQIPQNIIITGTNGKTTTARMLAHFIKRQKLKVIRNSTGSNLERGIASALVENSNWWRQIKDVNLGIWESDEAAFNSIVLKIKPQMIVFLNAFRDQLDRYGEVDTVVKRWQESLKKIDWDPTILVNGNDLNTLKLTESKAKFFIFGVPQLGFIGENASGDIKQTIKTDFRAVIKKNKGLQGQEITINFPSGSINLDFQIAGAYQVFNLLAAASVYSNLNLPIDAIKTSLSSFTPAFGRVEKIQLKGKEGYIFLIKNPVGASLVFETVASEIKKPDTLLIALNDSFADGTDVSWIWDAEFEKLTIDNGQLTITCSGTRAYDLAVRLKYAGVDQKQIQIEPSLEKALTLAQEETGGRVFILPTYTALLALQKLLAKLRIKTHYWKEQL